MHKDNLNQSDDTGENHYKSIVACIEKLALTLHRMMDRGGVKEFYRCEKILLHTIQPVLNDIN